jgi:hypothetical protein
MSTVAISSGSDKTAPHIAPGGARRKKPLVWLLASALLVAAVVGVVGVRLAARPSVVSSTPSARLHFVPLPSSPAIESDWGIRFTAVLLEADRGMVDLRYQVVDPAKSGRIHGGKGGVDPVAQLANLPTILLESGRGKLTPTSAMMHFEHFHFQTELVGNTYSLLYGNSGGLLHLGDKITIHMSDGEQLAHVVVAD